MPNRAPRLPPATDKRKSVLSFILHFLFLALLLSRKKVYIVNIFIINKYDNIISYNLIILSKIHSNMPKIKIFLIIALSLLISYQIYFISISLEIYLFTENFFIFFSSIPDIHIILSEKSIASSRSCETITVV